MIFSTIPISAAPYIPLSAGYRYDENIDLQPSLYEFDDGYSFFYQPLFTGTKDVKFANESFFSITSATVLNTFLNDLKIINPKELVFYTSFQAANGLYISNINNSLYAVATSVTETEFFRIIQNEDGTCCISQNNLYATIITNNNDFSITLTPQLTSDPTRIQKFRFETTDDENVYTIRTNFIMSSWSPYITIPIERFLSFSDGDATNKIKANGLIANGSYGVENNYKFSTTLNFHILSLGFDGKVVWVKYFNELLNKAYNKTTDVADMIPNIANNYLVEYPYKTQIDSISNNTGRMNINLITLKNILTPEYRYGLKKD